MIKLFRKIRQKLLTENKFSRYMVYAIGEIFLVVVGILIALSINTWNENRKDKIKEVKLLESFRTILQRDEKSFNIYILIYTDYNNSIDILLKYMETDLPYQDSLGLHFAHTAYIFTPQIKQEFFRSTSSSDLNLISNDSLKDAILTYYSWAGRTFDVRINRYVRIVENASMNIYNTRFNAIWNGTWNKPGFTKEEELMIPNDFEELKKDKEYTYFLKSLKNQMFWDVIKPLNQGKSLADNLINEIDRELKKMN